MLRSIRGVGALLLATTLLYASFYKEESLEINTSLISENRFFEQIIHWFPQLTQEHFFAFAIIALLMSITRFVEAFGLWFEKNWGNYLTITTGLITSIILETIILSKQMFLNLAFKTAIGMSLISMVAMEAAMNITDVILTGGAILELSLIHI